MNTAHLSRTVGFMLMCFLFPVVVFAQSKVSENKHFKSSVLKGEEVKYSIYLPPGYETSDRKYPVLYLLHGYSDDHTAWLRRGQVQLLADRFVAEGLAEEMIIVMPNGKVTWYVNNADGSDRYEDMFFKELIPHIESTYKVVSEKESRAISGLSMGGYGALVYTLRHPDMFVACYPMSSAVYTDEEMINMSKGQYNASFKSIYGDAEAGQSRLTPLWKKYSVLELIKTIPDADKRKVKIYATCGDDDFLFHGNAALWIALRENGIPSEFRVRDGGHSWTYWRETLKEVLPTVSSHFHR